MDNHSDQGVSKKSAQNSPSTVSNSTPTDESSSEPLESLQTETLETAVSQLDSILQQQHQVEQSNSIQSTPDDDGGEGPSSGPSVRSNDGEPSSGSQRRRARQHREQRMKNRIMKRVVDRTRDIQREMDDFMIGILHEMLRSEGLDIPKDELADGFEEFWKMYSTGMVKSGPWLDYWNDDQQNGASEE